VETDLQLAQRAAITGAAVALPHFAALADLPRELKSDGTVVTAADRAVESAIRDVLTAARPGDVVLGEEAGESGDIATSSRRWIIDPIDGTALFVRGDDRWLILIGLEEHGEIVTAVAAHPAQGSIWWAQRDAGAYEGRVVGGRVVAETVVRVSPDGPSSAAGSRFAVVPEDWGSDLVAPMKALTPARPWPIHPALMIARGDLDVALQTGGQIWDFAATSLIVTEAGGAYSGVNGSRRPSPGASVYAGSEPLLKSTLDVITTPRP
jgi:histidinol-phosphatase